MKGLTGFVAAAVLAAGVLAVPQSGAAADKTMTANGTVKSVEADSVVVTDKAGKDWTFTIDKDTKVFAKGGSHMTAEKKAAGETMTIADSVKVGEKVTVKYHEMGDKLHAASVRVL